MQKQRSLFLQSLSDTEAFGVFLGRTAVPGDVITLRGDLGCGKTTLTQAIGKGIAVPADHYITSPTFALMHEYPGSIPLYHLDLYRLADESEIEDLGFDELLYGKSDGLVIIEWPDRLGSLMPEERLEIELAFSNDAAEGRLLRLTAHGERYTRFLTFRP